MSVANLFYVRHSAIEMSACYQSCGIAESRARCKRFLQRLCIARAIAGDPEVLLLDEPCSALDPMATGKIEDLIQELKGVNSILIVTHNMQQAARTSDYTAFMYLGRVIEYGQTNVLFTNPLVKDTQDYITGRFG